MLRILVCALAAVWMAWAAPVHADEPTAKERREASRHVEEGRKLQEKGDYDGAIKRFRSAYRLIPHPQLLYNLGQAYRLKGDKKRAVSLYKQYIDRSPEGQTADIARRFVIELGDEIAQEEREAREERERRKRDRDDEKVVGDDDDDDDQPDDPPSAGRGARRAGMVVAGVGVLGLGAGVIFGARARGIQEEFDGAPWDPERQGRYDEGVSAERTMFIAYGVGAAALVAGAVLYVIGATSSTGGEESSDVALGASVEGSGARVWLKGRF